MNKSKELLDKHSNLKGLTNEHIHIAAYNSCLDAINEALTIGGVVSSKRKSNLELFNKMNNDFMQAIIDSDNGIYDPIEEFGKELEEKYIIIEKQLITYNGSGYGQFINGF